MAKYSEKQHAWAEDYNRRAYDSLTVRVKKGDKDRWKAAAEAAGESLNRFIADAVEQKIINRGS